MPESGPFIALTVDERARRAPRGTTLFALRDALKPGADVLVVNGFPRTADVELADGDVVALIRRGEIPARDELEALMAARHTPGVHARLKRAAAGIAGCGGLGSAAAIALARVGIGRLRLADFDVVEPSNLNRQQFFVDQIGRPKVEALAENLARINPFVVVETERRRIGRDDAAAVFAGCDVVLECFDDPRAKRDLLLGLRAGAPATPLVAASGVAGFGTANSVRVRRAMENVWVVGDGETAAAPGTGLMAPRVGVAAHHQANAALRLILGLDPAE